ncbi:MAG TPA: lysophospholipase [Polyangiales bacterium]|nr:lysophospholipase [Polyangiales bacterium]
MSDVDVIQSERTERASDGQRLHAYEWSSRANDPNQGALIVLMHGYAEHAGRYREFAEYLVRAGHVVHAFDARGHGQSGGQRGHIETYDRYVEDYYDFAQGLKQRFPNRPLILFGHSNGGLIALRTLQSKPRLADGVIVTSPLLALQQAHLPLPVWFAAIIARVAGRFPAPNGLKTQELTHDSRKLEQHKRDRLNHMWSTPRWYVSVHDAMNHAFANIESLRLPVLVLAAERDPIVVPDAVQRFYQAIPSTDKELIVVRDSLHEILNEVGREESYRRIGAWLAARWKTSAAA